jgi:homoserine kinase
MQNRNKVRIIIPATSANCGPGFDTLGIACSLYNELELEVNGPKDSIDIQVYGEGVETLPVNSRNLALRAVRMVLDKAEFDPRGIRLVLRNNIPLSRGLGSSSAAIVGGLVAANAIIGNRFRQDEILDMATKLEGHPDNVAPALFGGFTISVMQDEQVTCLRLPLPPELIMVACIPDFRLSTHKARQAIPSSVTHKDAVYNVSRAALLVGALASGQLEYLGEALEDKLHQPYRATLIPGMVDVFTAGRDAGALGVAMSGAGPSLMAYTVKNAEAVGEAMVKAFARQQITSRCVCLNVDYTGARIADPA